MPKKRRIFNLDTSAPVAVRTGVLEVVAFIRAQRVGELVQEAGRDGEGLTLKSLEVVAVLVLVADSTSIDPKDKNVLKACDKQTLKQLVDFISSRTGTSR